MPDLTDKNDWLLDQFEGQGRDFEGLTEEDILMTKSIVPPKPQSFNDYGYGHHRVTRNRTWWTDGKVITVDFTDWPNVEPVLSPCA